MYGKYSKDGRVNCQECGQPFKGITDKHLKVRHDMSLREYARKYKGYPLTGIKLGRISREDQVTIIIRDDKGKQRYLASTVKDFFTDKIKTQLEEIFEANKEKVKNKKVSMDELRNSIGGYMDIPLAPLHDSKEVILKYLKRKFPDIVPNYHIRKTTVLDDIGAQTVIFDYVTDMSIPSQKVDISFVEVFWHNDSAPVPNRTKRYLDLLSVGWKTLEIKGKLLDKKDVLKKVLEFIKSKRENSTF